MKKQFQDRIFLLLMDDTKEEVRNAYLLDINLILDHIIPIKYDINIKIITYT